MRAFLYIDLSSSIATYDKPVLNRVKRAFPEIAVLDLDAQSDALLQQYAVRLLHEAEKCVVCIRTDEEITAGFGSIMPVLEELLNPQPGRLLLLHGSNQRLLRMLQARPQIVFKVVEEEELLLQEVAQQFA